MTGRRMAGFLVALLMLNLNLVRADIACASHAAGHAASPATMPHSGSMHHAHELSGKNGNSHQHEKPCNTPSQADCCQVWASCSLLLGHNGYAPSRSVALMHDGVVAGIVSVPLSVIVPPDPPPPKA